MNNPNIVVIGGGTGTSTLLRELKTYPAEISAVINMSDNGGSSGVLRQQYDVMPPGDVRQCLSALSTSPEAAMMFEHRLRSGKDAGHVIGNLILADYERKHRSFDKAVKEAAQSLEVEGSVFPVTLDKHSLVLRDGDNTLIGEQSLANYHIQTENSRISHIPRVSINPEAELAISQADALVIAPGSLFRSLLPTLSVAGVRETLNASIAPKIMVSNLATEPGHTDGWHVADYVDEVEKYIGKDQVSHVIYNTQQPAGEVLEQYKEKGQAPVRIDKDGFSFARSQAIGMSLLGMVAEDLPDGGIVRNRLRHDAVVLAQEVFSLIG